MADRFLICLPFTLAQECPYPNDWTRITGPGPHDTGNFSNDAHDPGGATMCGLIQREFDVWRKGHGQPTAPVIQVPQIEGYAMYQTLYWLPHCPSLAPGLDLQFLDESVNAGTTEATKVLQVVLGLTNDGIWGPQTQAAATLSVQDTAAKVAAFTARRETVYREMSGFQYFGKDWIRRSQEIGAAALAMTAPPMTGATS
jgi:lysozyme family protein